MYNIDEPQKCNTKGKKSHTSYMISFTWHVQKRQTYREKYTNGYLGFRGEWEGFGEWFILDLKKLLWN